MVNRREYERFPFNISVLIFKQGCDDINVDLVDISEHGLSFQFSRSEFETFPLVVGDKLEIQFVDKFYFGTVKEEYLICEDAIVIHINEAASGYLVGCKIVSQRFADYVVRRYTAEISNHSVSLMSSESSI